MIEVKNLKKSSSGKLVVDGVSFDVGRGRNLVLLGASGSGKTTTLKMINRLLEPDSGEVWVAGRNTTDRTSHRLRREIGYVFQQVGLFPNMTVGQNIAITPQLLGWDKAEIDARVDELLDLVELPGESIKNRLPTALSGGQAQRVGVARALAARPQVMLLDEPFGALDPLTRGTLQRFFRKLQRTVGMTSVFVTHDMFEALFLADWIVVMQEGKIVQQGTPHNLLANPSTPYVAELMATPTEHAAYVDTLLSQVQDQLPASDARHPDGGIVRAHLEGGTSTVVLGLLGVTAGVLVLGALGLWFTVPSGADGAAQLAHELTELPDLLMAHIPLSLAALFSATVFSIPVGVLASRAPRVQQVALGLAGIVQTVPSLALLAFMVPLLSGIGLPGIGFLPAYLGLTAYCILPILLNTVTGLAEVDGALLQAADGVGMTAGQRLFRVELPLALPVIGGGLRTATVWCVGMATLSTPVGAPSLGNLIFTGLQTRNSLKVMVGCVAAACLAQVLDRALQALEVSARRRSRSHVVLGAALLSVVAWFGINPDLGRGGVTDAGSLPTVEIGAKAFSESLILSELMGQLLEQDGTARYRVRPALGSSVAFDAVATGQIDLMVDYTGTVLAMVMKASADGLSREEVTRQVTEYLEQDRGLAVLAAIGFENTYTFAMPEASARALRVQSVSDLVRHAPGLRFGSDYEFFEREEWAFIRDRYGLEPKEKLPMDPSLMYEALESGAVDVIGAYSTDGRIAALGLRTLVDDRHAIPPYDAMIVGRPGICEAHPGVCRRLRRLEGRVSADDMRAMNRAVDLDHRPPGRVAADFLASLKFPQ